MSHLLSPPKTWKPDQPRGADSNNNHAVNLLLLQVVNKNTQHYYLVLCIYCGLVYIVDCKQIENKHDLTDLKTSSFTHIDLFFLSFE